MGFVMLFSLGLFAFSIDTIAFDELQRRASWRHSTSPRVGARDASQFVGIGEETISLPGTVYREIADGEVSIDALRDMAASGDPWALVDGSGRVYGAFVITTIDERRKTFIAGGVPLRIDFAIELLRVDAEGNQ
jgi:uncharacterized protein